jgi:hypothetical protein
MGRTAKYHTDEERKQGRREQRAKKSKDAKSVVLPISVYIALTKFHTQTVQTQTKTLGGEPLILCKAPWNPWNNYSTTKPMPPNC